MGKGRGAWFTAPGGWATRRRVRDVWRRGPGAGVSQVAQRVGAEEEGWGSGRMGCDWRAWAGPKE
jgi:hypothetical protein